MTSSFHRKSRPPALSQTHRKSCPVVVQLLTPPRVSCQAPARPPTKPKLPQTHHGRWQRWIEAMCATSSFLPWGDKKNRLLSILITFECYFVWLSVLFAQNQINHRHLRGRDIYPRETWRCAILKMIYFILVKHLLIDSGVAKTRVRVTPKVEVRVGVRMGVRLEGEGEFKGRVKAYGNITVPMIMHRSRLLSNRLLSCSYHSSVTLTGFVEYKKEIFSQKLCSFADKAFRKKNRSKSWGRLEINDRKFVYWSPSPGLTSEFSYYSTHGNQLESRPIVW